MLINKDNNSELTKNEHAPLINSQTMYSIASIVTMPGWEHLLLQFWNHQRYSLWPGSHWRWIWKETSEGLRLEYAALHEWREDSPMMMRTSLFCSTKTVRDMWWPTPQLNTMSSKRRSISIMTIRRASDSKRRYNVVIV